jgi:hypothetical protein
MSSSLTHHSPSSHRLPGDGSVDIVLDMPLLRQYSKQESSPSRRAVWVIGLQTQGQEARRSNTPWTDTLARHLQVVESTRAVRRYDWRSCSGLHSPAEAESFPGLWLSNTPNTPIATPIDGPLSGPGAASSPTFATSCTHEFQKQNNEPAWDHLRGRLIVCSLPACLNRFDRDCHRTVDGRPEVMFAADLHGAQGKPRLDFRPARLAHCLDAHPWLGTAATCHH